MVDSNNKALVASNTIFTLTLSDNDKIAITYKYGDVSTIVITSINFDVYEIYDTILSECPDDLKLTGEYLYSNYNNVVEKGTAKFQKNGLEYQVYKGTNGSTVIMLGEIPN